MGAAVPRTRSVMHTGDPKIHGTGALSDRLPERLDDAHDLTAQCDATTGLGIKADRIDVHHDLTGTVESARPLGPSRRPERRGQEPSAAGTVRLSACSM